MNLDFSGKTCAVLGVGISNTPLIEFLLAHGAKVTACDKKPFEALPEAAKAFADKGVSFRCGENYLEGITEDVIFKSPGIRFDKPQILEAVKNGSVLTSEMELFFENCPCPIIGVTGSDGKTTTTTLISKALGMQYGEDKVFVGGNIGRPLLPIVETLTPDCFAVVELSSFQLHTMKRSPHISIITNLSPNHLDYHLGMEEYVEAKTNIFSHQVPGDRVVLNYGNERTRALKDRANEGVEVVYFNGSEGVYEKDGVIYDGETPILPLSDILLPGRHNVENYMGVIGVLRGLVSPEVIRELARTFGGVEHRIELVRVKDGVKYYNSSIDSSPTRTLAALNSFTQKLIVVMGGYDKHIPFDPLGDPVCEKVKTLVLTGATAEKIRAAVVSSPKYEKEHPTILMEPDFNAAVKLAASCAKDGDIVVLSPACASFDAFPNFEVRGRTFKSIVQGL